VNVVSAGNGSWVITASVPPATLEILLQRQTVILSWNQFVYAEGDSEQLRIAFASHDVVIKGAGLDPLLPAIAAHRVVSLRESVLPSVFPARSGGSFGRSWSKGSKASDGTHACDTCFEMAIELRKWIRSCPRTSFENRHHP